MEDFGKIDKDGSGYIESSELPKLFLQQTGRAATDQELLVLLQQFDTNHDGRVSLDEYMDPSPNPNPNPNWRSGLT